MELYEAMRSNPSCRYFTEQPVDDSTLFRIFDNARFASSGGNRQGWRTVVVRKPETKAQLAALHGRQWDRYLSHARDGVVGFQTNDQTKRMDSYNTAQHRLDRTDDFAKALAEVPVLLVCCIELWTLAVTDKDLGRQSIVGGGSLYPFVQNVLLGCRNEGLGSALTTLVAAEEAEVVRLLDIPEDLAVGALVAVGWPVPDRQYTKLSRKPVAEVVFSERFGNPFVVDAHTNAAPPE